MEGWRWPLEGCCTLYYNLLQALSEISLIHESVAETCYHTDMAHENKHQQCTVLLCMSNKSVIYTVSPPARL